MNGTLIPGTPIVVDCWHHSLWLKDKIFFLTHFHGDHRVGLTSSWQHPIYCSPITGVLLKQELGIQSKLVKDLEVNQSHIIQLSDSEDSETLTVTLIDANHCPGAVMFVFEGYFGKILHTGDFRFSPEMMSDDCLASKMSEPDVLYLDNTYCDPACVFPTRYVAKLELLDILRSHPDHIIYLGMHSLGKEELLIEIAQELQTWISISPKRMRLMETLQAPNMFTVNQDEARIRVVTLHSLTNKKITSLQAAHPTVVILLTALYVGLPLHPFCRLSDVYVLPYSDHSSFLELEKFVKAVRPKSVVPVVVKQKGIFGCDTSKRSNMDVFRKYLSTKRKHDYLIPECIEKTKASRNSTPRECHSRQRRKLKTVSLRRNSKQKGVVFDSPEKENEQLNNTITGTNHRTEVSCGANGSSGDVCLKYSGEGDPVIVDSDSDDSIEQNGGSIVNTTKPNTETQSEGANEDLCVSALSEVPVIEIQLSSDDELRMSPRSPKRKRIRVQNDIEADEVELGKYGTHRGVSSQSRLAGDSGENIGQIGSHSDVTTDQCRTESSPGRKQRLNMSQSGSSVVHIKSDDTNCNSGRNPKLDVSHSVNQSKNKMDKLILKKHYSSGDRHLLVKSCYRLINSDS